MNEHPDNFPYPLDLVFWGPKGSGKSSLIYGFADLVNSRFALIDKFEYCVLNPENRNKLYIPPPQDLAEIKNGTAKYNIKYWLFERQPRDRLSFVQSRKLKMSTFSHLISFYDDAGENLVKFVLNGELLTDPEINSNWVRFADARNIILLLDPSLILESPDHVRAPKALYTRQEYVTFTDKLCTLLWERKPIPRRLAVCLAKADLLDHGRVAMASANTKQAWDLINETFGDEMSKVLWTKKKQFEIKPFVISTQKRNINRWEPVGIENPFFWMLEGTELQMLDHAFSGVYKLAGMFGLRKKLKNIVSSTYIRYPYNIDSGSDEALT